MFSNKKTAKPGKTPDNYKQQIHNKLDSALEGLDIDIFTNHHDDSVIFQKKSQTPDDCDNDTTIPYVDDQSSPIHSQFNPFVTPWAKPTLPTSIRPLRLSFVQKLVIPLSKKPAPVAVNPLLKTPQQLASLYPKLPTSTLATASIATTATSAPTVTSTTSTVVSSAIVPVTTTAATAGATATTIPGTISTTTSTSSSGRTVQPSTNIFNMSSILKIEKFKGDNTQNPETWLTNFNQYCSFYDLSKKKVQSHFLFIWMVMPKFGMIPFLMARNEISIN
ncbi:unnamed protein product [Mytilus coruscus]|uniref:Uncharacterized protein n=1 Tax=Mytilus coruscus TaxID=42192 RepID=A0A6J8ENF4_MYTCO|nr:unnamed protein product [Mytilus coruscus]